MQFICTNNHVISSMAEAHTAEILFEYMENSPSARGQLDPARYFATTFSPSDKGLDFTIVALKGPRVAFPGIVLPQIPPEPKIGSPVHIFQHPDGMAMQYATHTTCGLTVQDVRYVRSLFPFVLLKIVPTSYLADTDPGSSGSPVLNENFILIAVYKAGHRDGNRGTRMDAIMQ